MSSNNSWQKVTFDQLCKNISDRIEDPKQSKTDYYIGLEHLDSEDPKISRHGSPQDVSKTKLLFKSGQILFGKRNWYLRRLAVAKRDGICSAHMLVLDPIEGKSIKDFVSLLMFSDDFYEKALMVSAGSMSPTIKWKDISKLEFIIPSIPEQENILNITHKIDDTISKNQNLIEKTTNYIFSKSESLLTKGINHTKFKKINMNNDKTTNIPENWIVSSLESVIGNKKNSLKRGPWGSSLKKSFFVKSGFKVYQQQNAIYTNVEYGDYYIDDDKFHELKDFEVKSGDFIISCSGTIGKIYQIPTQAQKGIINQALLKISINENVMDNNFFKFLFQSFGFQRLFLSSSHGSAMKNVPSIKQIKQIPIFLPPISEQKQISNIILDLNNHLAQQQSHLINLKSLRKSILNSRLTKETSIVTN